MFSSAQLWLPGATAERQVMNSEEKKLIEAVNRGAAMLDVFYFNWHTAVDCRELDMWGDKSSVLGQLYGSHEKGIEALARRDSFFAKRPDEAAYAHGFNVRAGKGDPAWGHANRLWIGHVNKRLGLADCEGDSAAIEGADAAS